MLFSFTKYLLPIVELRCQYNATRFIRYLTLDRMILHVPLMPWLQCNASIVSTTWTYKSMIAMGLSLQNTNINPGDTIAISSRVLTPSLCRGKKKVSRQCHKGSSMSRRSRNTSRVGYWTNGYVVNSMLTRIIGADPFAIDFLQDQYHSFKCNSYCLR